MRDVFPSRDDIGRMNRRSFVRAAALGAAALAVPSRLLADPFAPLPGRPSGRPVRIRGQVRTAGGGVAGVAVSDGLAVVDSAADGTFELIAVAGQPFVQISLPAHCEIPTNTTGTARFYQTIRPDAADEMNVVFELRERERSDIEHVLLLLPDPQTENTQEMAWLHEQTVPDVRALADGMGDREVFGLACGDIMFDNLEFYPEYERAVQRMGVPFFQVVGNHDLDQDNLTDETSTETFSSHFGPRYYSFDRGEVHYVVLDDVFWHGSGYFGYLAADQLRWLDSDLARIEAGRTVIVALHIPVLGSSHVRRGERDPRPSLAVMNRELLYRLLEPYDAHVLSGHTHENEHLFDGGVHEHVSGTVCGAWWSGPICGDGTPNGYSVYEIRGSQVSWCYKSTGLGFEHQIRAYPRGADPKAPDEIVANVWDWDPAWSVIWYEDGERKGEMAQRTGHDPLSVRLHTGPDLPPRREWVEPYLTRHLFYAPASRAADKITVEATDRFGRVYSTVVPAFKP